MKDLRVRIFEEYLEKNKLENRDIEGKKSTMKIYFRYLDEEEIDFLRISIAEAQGFQTCLTMRTHEDGSLYYGTPTVLSMITRITSFYEYLKMRKLIIFNPYHEITRLREERNLPWDILSEEDMGIALNVFRKFMKGEKTSNKRMLYKAHLIAEVMYSTGARIHEIAGLKVSDVDLIRGVVTLHDRKTQKERRGFLNEYTLSILKVYIEKTRPYVLTDKSDESYLFGTHNHIRRWINDMMKNAIAESLTGEKKQDINFTSHSFRHSVASHLLKNGCDIRYIQEILGHESIASTQIYTRVVKEDLRQIIDSYHPRSMQRVESEELMEGGSTDEGI